MRNLLPLLEKEVKDLLRDPRIYIGLLVPVVILPVMGFIMSTVLSTSFEAAMRRVSIAVLDYDKTEFSNLFIGMLRSIGIKVETIHTADLVSAMREARNLGSENLIVIREGFGSRLANFTKADIEVYTIIESIGLGSMGAFSIVDTALTTSSKALSNMLILRLNTSVNSEAIREPLNITVRSIIKNRVLEISPLVFFQQVYMNILIVPMLIFILSITVTQVAATATAVENEEKTLETLLTFPVARYEILLAKLLCSSILAVIGGILFMAGFTIYFEKIFSIPGFGPVTGLSGLIPTPSLENLMLLTVSLVLVIIFVTSLGVIIGALSSDVRMANSLLGIVIIPVVISFLLIVYGDLKTLPLLLQVIAYALPTSYPMVIAKEMIISSVPSEALFGIPYSAALTIIILYFTGIFFRPEKLLTLQHKIMLRRGKKQPGEVE